MGRAHPSVSYAQPRAAVPACSAACQATPCSLRYAVEWEWAGVHAWPAGPRSYITGHLRLLECCRAQHRWE